jgi:hypothetical protein
MGVRSAEPRLEAGRGKRGASRALGITSHFVDDGHGHESRVSKNDH